MDPLALCCRTNGEHHIEHPVIGIFDNSLVLLVEIVQHSQEKRL